MNTKACASGLLVAAGLMSFSNLGFAAPIVTFTVSAPGNQHEHQSVLDTRDEYLGRLRDGAVTEHFDGFATLSQSQPMLTAVGTFRVAASGNAGCALPVFDMGCSAVAVLDSTTTVYSGRYSTLGGNWLDSMDAQILDFSPIEGINSIGFFLTDAMDAIGSLYTFTITSGGYDIELGALLGETRLPDGNLHYISFTSKEPVSNLRIATNHTRDGFGIYGITVGNNPRNPNPVASVPEPASLALLGLGLLGPYLGRRRRRD